MKTTRTKMKMGGVKMKMGGAKKYGPGGPTDDDNPSYREQKKSAKQNQKLAAINAKTERIKAGTEPSTYEKVSDIAGKAANVATTVGQGISAVKDMRGRNNDPSEQKRGGAIKLKKAMYGSSMMKKGGATKKYGPGGPTSQSKPTRPKDQPQPLKKATAVTTVPKNNGAKASKMPTLKNGGGPKKINTAGGIPITARAADRKISKGKGMMTYKYGPVDPIGTGNNKGTYRKFAKDKEPSPFGGKSFTGKGRTVRKMGGATKKK